MSDTHSPIHLLPPEILGYIFGLAVIAGKETCRPARSHRSYHSYAIFYNFSFVSQYWRSVALSTPSIWHTLLFVSRKLVSVVLERSKMANLSIHYHSSYHLRELIPLIMGVINDHASRITEITLDICDFGFFTLLKELQQRPPSLRPCEIRFRIFSAQIYTTLQPNAILVTDRLKILEVENLTLVWGPSQSFPCLTHLIVGEISVVADFITALGGMPALEFLRMGNFLPSSVPVQLVQPVQLAKLRILEIVSKYHDFSDIPIFLTLTTLPAATDILVCCDSDRMWHHPKLSALTSSLYSLFRNMRMQPDSEGFKDCYNPSVLLCRSANNGLRLVANVETHHPSINFELILEIEYNPEKTIREIFPAHLRNEILSLTLAFGLRSKILFHLSDTLPFLRNIVLEDMSMSNFIAVMMIRKVSSFPFPNLRRLTLYRAKFSWASSGLEARELRNCLAERSNSGVKLDELKILFCYGIYEKDIQLLREVVDVEWDGFVDKRP